MGTTETITTLSIDTSEFEHLCVQLSFTANIGTAVIDGFRFQIFKQCPDQAAPTPVSGIYDYTELLLQRKLIPFILLYAITISV